MVRSICFRSQFPYGKLLVYGRLVVTLGDCSGMQPTFEMKLLPQGKLKTTYISIAVEYHPFPAITAVMNKYLQNCFRWTDFQYNDKEGLRGK